MSRYRPYRTSAQTQVLFLKASTILKKLNDGGSYNSLIFNNRCRDPQGLAALVSKASQYRSIIDRVIAATRLLELESKLDVWLLRILIAHLCFGGKQRLVGVNKTFRAVLTYKKEIQEAVEKEDKFGVRSLNQVIVGRKPRYVRVNTLKISTEEFIKILKDEGYGELICPESYDKFLQLVEDTMIHKKTDEIFMRDYHVKDMLVFPRDTFLQNHPAYSDGQIVLQDKASCLQSCCVSPPPGSVVLDMCAAPGMKTSLYAAIIQNKGKVYAIERSPYRFKDMQNILKSLGATCVTTINNDAGIVGPETCENVEYIVVDPSCSGSGMSGRAKLDDVEAQFKPKEEQLQPITQSQPPSRRVQKLQNLQTYLLKHALSNFPLARCVVYSTCSTDPLENEAVVEKCLNCARLNGFGVMDVRSKLKGWRHFGHPAYKCGERTVYTKGADLMNGGFFAVFERGVVEVEEKEVVGLVKKEVKQEEEEMRRRVGEEELVISLAVELLALLPGTVVLNLSQSCSIQATTYLIQKQMPNVGKVYVLNGQHDKTLAADLETSCGACVEVKELSALESSDTNCPGVESVLVFPESSGCTSTNKLLSSDDPHQKFVAKQFSLLRHGLTAFPNVKRVVYATTSVHPAENEEIIDALLVVAKFRGFSLVDAVARVGDWQNSRQSTYHFGEKCLMQEEEDSGKGLFVAMFERGESLEGLDDGEQLKGGVQDESGQEFEDSSGASRRSASAAKDGRDSSGVSRRSASAAKDGRDSSGVSRRSAAKDRRLKEIAGKKSGQGCNDLEDSAGVSGSVYFGADATVLSNTADVPKSSADSTFVSNMVDVPNSALGSDSALVQNNGDVSESTFAAGSDLALKMSNGPKSAEDLTSTFAASSADVPQSTFRACSNLAAKLSGGSADFVSASSAFFVIDKEGNMCNKDGTKRNCDDFGSEKMKRKVIWNNARSRGRYLRQKGKRKAKLVEKSDPETSYLPSHEGTFTPDTCDKPTKMNCDDFGTEKMKRRKIWNKARTRWRYLPPRGKKKAKIADTADSKKSLPANVGNLPSDILSTGSDFFVIDREGKMGEDMKMDSNDFGSGKKGKLRNEHEVDKTKNLKRKISKKGNSNKKSKKSKNAQKSVNVNEC